MKTNPKQTTKARPPSFGTACAGTIVTIIVGPEHKKRSIHKALLIHHSEYFRKALSGPWKEVIEDTIQLEDVDPSAVEIFAHWLYTGQIPEARDRSEWIDIIGETKKSLFQIQFMAYTLADRFRVTELQRLIHNSLVDYVETEREYWDEDGSTTLRWAQQAFANMKDNQPILQLLVGADLCKFPPAFLARFARRQADIHRHQDRQQACGERCYYVHVDEAEEKECGEMHMRYDTEKGTGYFGEKSRCFSCRVTSTRDAPAEDSDEAGSLEKGSRN